MDANFSYLFVCCDYLINTDPYVHVGVCVGNRSHQQDADSRKIGRHNNVADVLGRHFRHVGDRQKCLSFDGCSRGDTSFADIASQLTLTFVVKVHNEGA